MGRISEVTQVNAKTFIRNKAYLEEDTIRKTEVFGPIYEPFS